MKSDQSGLFAIFVENLSFGIWEKSIPGFRCLGRTQLSLRSKLIFKRCQALCKLNNDEVLADGT